MATAPDATAAALWRRQAVLVLLTALLLVVAGLLVAVVVDRTAAADSGVAGPVPRSAPPVRHLTWAVAAAAVATAALLGACLAHVARVASFTFRKET